MRRFRTLSVSLALAACASAAGVALYLAPLNSFAFANRIEDYRAHVEALEYVDAKGLVRAASLKESNDSIALITIDEASIGNTRAGLRTWPFARSTYGKLLDRLAQAGAKVAVFDIDFLEPSTDPSQDRKFAAAAQRIPTAIGYTVSTTASGIAGAELPPPALRSLRAGFTTIDTPGGLVIGQPLRIAPMPPGFPGGAASALALVAAEAYRGSAIDISAIPSLNGELLIAPFREAGHVDFRARVGSQAVDVGFVSQSLSFADALMASPDQLRVFARGKLVLVGATAQALSDFAPTVDGLYPGVYVHARLIDQLLRKTFVTSAPTWLDLTLIVLLPLLLAALLSQVRPPMALTLGCIVLLTFVGSNVALFAYRLYWLDLVHAGGSMACAALAVVGYRVLTEASQRRFITEIFGRHVSHAVVNELLKSDDPKVAFALSGKRATATIFYSDIRGFTPFSEGLPAEAIYAQLNEYFEAMCAVIFKYGGYIDKFIGDCIMVVFSAPHQTSHDPRNAVEAALEQQRVIGELGERWRAQGKHPFAVGMGINTGTVVMGNLGSSGRMNYTVIGDSVNIAARLYDAAAGGQVIISESTYEEVKAFFECRELEPLTVKGKSAPLRTFEVLRHKSEGF